MIKDPVAAQRVCKSIINPDLTKDQLDPEDVSRVANFDEYKAYIHNYLMYKPRVYKRSYVLIDGNYVQFDVQCGCADIARTVINFYLMKLGIRCCEKCIAELHVRQAF